MKTRLAIAVALLSSSSAIAGGLTPQGSTITSVGAAAGGGLTGGGVGGPVYLGIQPCPNPGQSMVWTGSAYACGDVASKVAGAATHLAVFMDASHVGSALATDDGTTLTIPEAVRTAAINGAIVATTHTDVGIQAAIDAAPDGGTVLLESGVVYAISNTINVTKRMIIIDCQGWPHNGGLQVDAGMSTSSPVFLVKPPAGITNQGVTFRNCMIMSVSGAPASAGIAIDGTFGNVGYLVLDHVWINHLGGPAIKVQNASGLATGTPYNTHVTNASILDNGADFTNGGDSISIDGSSILTGAGSLIVDTVGGNFQMDHVTSILGGGIIIKRALAGIISHSNIEQTVTSTEANNCMIDVQGDATSPPSNFVVEDNDLQANSAFVGCTIRVDHAVHTQIRNNYVVQGATNSYTITANANRTIIDHNRAAPDNPVSSFLSDSGTNTTGCFVNQTSGALSCLGLIGMTSAAGATGVVLSSTQVKVAPTGVLGVSTAAPDVSGLQVALWSSGSNAWRMGTAYGDASANLALGTLDATGHITADTGLTAFDSPGTGLARDGTSPNKLNVSLTTTSCSAGQHVNTINAAGTGGCSADTDPGITGTGGRGARFATSSTLGNSAFADDGTNASIAGTLGVGTATPGGAVSIVTTNATNGVAPAAWSSQYVTIGACTGTTGSCLGIGYNSSASIGVIMTALAPNAAHRAMTLNASQYTVDVSGTTKLSIDTSGNATFVGTIATSNGPKWQGGTGAPAINCAIGDLFSRTDGSTSTTLYVCTATNTWTAK